jgi:malate/lactate dehydrogenase
MKVMIVGAGRLGSQVAFMTLLKIRPDKLILSDIKDVSGDILDLQHACRGLGIKTKITKRKEPCEFIIITCGTPRNKKIISMKSLLKINKPLIEQVIKDIRPFVRKDTKVIVMTNPVKELTELVEKLLPINLVASPENILMSMRNQKELGWKIVKTKGYTNFGPSVSAILLLEQLIKSNKKH